MFIEAQFDIVLYNRNPSLRTERVYCVRMSWIWKNFTAILQSTQDNGYSKTTATYTELL